MRCELRPMESKDLPITFAWRNEDQVRKTSMSSNPISFNEHEAMFKYNNAVKLIFEVDGSPAGYVSCSRDPDEPTGEWGFHLGPDARGKGYSEIMLRMALIELKRLGFTWLTAQVRLANLPSLHIHNKLDFTEQSVEMVDKSDFVKFVREL